MVADDDVGFKLVYTVCKFGTNAKGKYTRSCDDSRDWSDDRGVAYRWLGDFQECDRARLNIDPADMKLNADDPHVRLCTSDKCAWAYPKLARDA